MHLLKGNVRWTLEGKVTGPFIENLGSACSISFFLMRHFNLIEKKYIE